MISYDLLGTWQVSIYGVSISFSVRSRYECNILCHTLLSVVPFFLQKPIASSLPEPVAHRVSPFVYLANILPSYSKKLHARISNWHKVVLYIHYSFSNRIKSISLWGLLVFSTFAVLDTSGYWNFQNDGLLFLLVSSCGILVVFCIFYLKFCQLHDILMVFSW